METQGKSRPKKHQNTIISQYPILENGQEKVPYQQKPHQRDTTLISSQLSLPQLSLPQLSLHQLSNHQHQTFLSQRKSSTQESPLENNQKISNDNQDTSLHSIQTTTSLQTSVQGSTSREKDLKPFWNNSSKEISKRLWLPTKTDLQDLDSITFNGCSNNMERYLNHWTKKTWIPEKTYFQTLWKSSQYSQQDTTVEENINQENQKRIVTRKIRFYPTQNQKLYFNKCFFTHRYFYNKAIEEINRRFESRKKEFQESKTCVHCKKEKSEENSFTCDSHSNKSLPWKLNITLPSLRKTVMKSNSELIGSRDVWQSDIPFDTRGLAINDAVSMYLSATSNMKNGNIRTFRLKYKSRKNNRHIFWVDHRALKQKKNKWCIFQQKLKKECFLRFPPKNKDSIPDIIESDFKIMKDRGSYYLLISKEEEISENKELEISNIVALDPGVRTFQTGFGVNGTCFEAGKKQTELIKKLHEKIDYLKSKQSESNRRSSIYHMKKRIEIWNKKVYDVISDLHNQFGSFLCKGYDKIFLPRFETSGMQESYKLQSLTKRMMSSLRHFDFQNKLRCLCDKYCKKLYLVSEEYTSKTCGFCGKLNEVGSSKEYKCNCGIDIDRDINGARNILIKSLTIL